MASAGVRFSPTAEYSRQPTSSESRLFNDFADHEYVCRECNVSERNLCPFGRELAQEITARVYYRDGKTLSMRDREQDNEVVNVEIPKGCEAVRKLLKALEHRHRKVRHDSRRPAQSYDRSYYIPPRTAQYATPQETHQSHPPAAAVPVMNTSPGPYYAQPYYTQEPQTAKSPYYLPLQYPAPLPMPPRTRKRYSTNSAPAPYIYEAPDPAPQQTGYYGYYR